MIPRYPLTKQPPIYLAASVARSARRIPVSLLIFVCSAALLAFNSFADRGDAGAVLAAIGCAGIIASIYRPTRVATSERVYTVRIGGRLWRMYGDDETDKMVDEGRW